MNGLNILRNIKIHNQPFINLINITLKPRIQKLFNNNVLSKNNIYHHRDNEIIF